MIATAALLALGKPVAVCAHEELAEGFYNLLDQNETVVFQTAIVVSVGDEFIAADNGHYKVVSIEGDRARCDYLGLADLEAEATTMISDQELSIAKVLGESLSPVRGQQPTVALYHTHSDESYVPSDGTASIYGKGGIFKVGSAFAKALRAKGLNVVHNTTSHDPHDAMSYTRSRRTASALMRGKPLALFDVHRDAVPAELYAGTINGEDIAKITLVVGRQNPKTEANLAFAKRLKAANDKQNPGLIKGIFMARGGYNQDLFDQALLLEVGSHENSRQEAERGIELFASSVPGVVGAQTKPTGKRLSAPQANRVNASLSAIGKILLLITVSAGVYLYLITGSVDKALRRARQFFRREFKEFSSDTDRHNKNDRPR